jgi:hypothetical protein
MAIAPSKLGRLIREEWQSEERIIDRLRDSGLVKERATDDDLRTSIRRAIDEHAAFPPGQREFNSPEERVRVFLARFLSRKGKKWAVPLVSLELPDDDRPWWKFWKSH